MPGRRVQGPLGCPFSAPLLMVNVAGQQWWRRRPQAISMAIGPGNKLYLAASVRLQPGHSNPATSLMTPSSCLGCPPATLTMALWVTVSPALPLLEVRWRRSGWNPGTTQCSLAWDISTQCPLGGCRVAVAEQDPSFFFPSSPFLISSAPSPVVGCCVSWPPFLGSKNHSRKDSIFHGALCQLPVVPRGAFREYFGGVMPPALHRC